MEKRRMYNDIAKCIYTSFDTIVILFLSSLTSRNIKFPFAHCNRVVIQGIGEVMLFKN